MTPVQAMALLLVSVEPTDRALAGWCPLDGRIVSDEAQALAWVKEYTAHGGMLT